MSNKTFRLFRSSHLAGKYYPLKKKKHVDM